ncbi:hypothetical protein BDV30DRAFT_225104 [Aspergillus minisclerotigenes]|uniref:Apple domain-containing protein n=1 Tax=Aspergillus minisclerotigenes TaxID=656917 RepID=A0A5N6JBB5_9EURO|nr:hypothetical protein BDV30DRAFT_225104 [Aspergillus minisclerotigenes]
MFGTPLLLLLPLTTSVLSKTSDAEYNKICPRGDDLVTLPSGNKIRYLCDDCLIDPVAEFRSAKTIEECADICSTEDCKATIWSNGRCFSSKLTYIGPSPGSSPDCIWMTSQTCLDSKDDCAKCVNDKEECENQKRKCEDALAKCKPGDDECEKKARKCQNDLATCEDDKAKAEKKERKCQDDLTTCEDGKNDLEKEKRECETALASCKPGDEECEKKARKCRDDLITCEDDKDRSEKKERKCQKELLTCEDEKNECEKNERKCQADLQDSQKKASDLQKSVDQCGNDLDKCKNSGSSWGKTDGEIKCKSGSLTTATLNGNKWYTLCGFIINDVKGGVRGLTLKQCVESCSEDDKLTITTLSCVLPEPQAHIPFKHTVNWTGATPIYRSLYTQLQYDESYCTLGT